MWIKKLNAYFSGVEKLILVFSISLIITFFCIFDRENFLNLFLSVFGVISIMLSAKGNVIGKALSIFFGLAYGFISLSCAYYGEMITYWCMNVPMEVIALITWLKNPSKNSKYEVKINKIQGKEFALLGILSVAVTITFYFILKFLNTSNLLISTFSVFTSFTAVYLCYRRSPYFSLAFLFNDVVLIILWSITSLNDISYISVVICFVAFLFNDFYAFYNWNRLLKKQIFEEV